MYFSPGIPIGQNDDSMEDLEKQQTKTSLSDKRGFLDAENLVKGSKS